MDAGRARRVAGSLVAECQRVLVVVNSARQLSEDPNGSVHEIVVGRNVGFGAAAMLGVACADTEVVLVLNDDLELGAGFATAMLEPFVDPAVHAVAARLLAPSSARVDSLGLAVDRTLRSDDVRHLARIDQVIGPSGAAAAYRRSTLLAIGGFAPELFAYWEDTDVALGLWAAGHRCHVALDAVAIHRRGSTGGFRSNQQRVLDAYGRGFVLGRYRSWLSPTDRLCVPLVDWPSLLRSCVKLGSLAPIRARRDGRRAGTARPAEPVRGSPAAVPLAVTLREQWR
jgi:GT2 family glycosyltransferase